MKSICVTGFYASGSSACLDYLSEYESTSFINGKEDYEHSMFYIGDGLFELYDRLYSDKSNYISRSHALNDYVDLVNNQYNNNFGWFGSYKLLLGENFKKISNDFINSISSKQGVAVDVADYYGVHFSLIKGLLQLGAHFIYKYKISKFGRKYKKKTRVFRYLIADENTFRNNAKIFLEAYSKLCNKNNTNIIVHDHLVSAEQLYGIKYFLPDSYKVIIVDRNPVDLYLVTKKIWGSAKFGYAPPTPLAVEDFCWNYMYQRRNLEKMKEMSNVLYIKFEELVQDYDKVIKIIDDFCGLKKEEHKFPKKYFNPEISINNIDLESCYPEEKENIAQIKKLISSSFYSYEKTKICTNRKKEKIF